MSSLAGEALVMIEIIGELIYTVVVLVQLFGERVKDAWCQWSEAVGRLEDWRVRVTRRLAGAYGGVVPLQKKINQPQLEECCLRLSTSQNVYPNVYPSVYPSVYLYRVSTRVSTELLRMSFFWRSMNQET